MTQTPLTTVPTGKEVYDKFMVNIEPELVTDVIPLLAEKYKNETPAEHTDRMKRYENAYAEYDRRAEEWLGKLHKLVRSSRQEALAIAEQKSRQEESPLLTKIESQLTS